MMKIYNKVAISLIATIIGLSASLHACMITFINDSNQTVILYDLNDLNNKNSVIPKVVTSIATKKTHRFGNNKTHAHFVIYLKEPKSKNFKLVYEAKQHACGSKNNPHIKLSDLENNSGEASLFSIKKDTQPHTSMVGRLPMIEKPELHKNERSGCSSCTNK